MSKRIYPAIGIMLFLGNFYMSWMASRMKEQYEANLRNARLRSDAHTKYAVMAKAARDRKARPWLCRHRAHRRADRARTRVHHTSAS